MTQSPIVHIHDTGKGDGKRVYVKTIAVMQMIVYCGGKQVVGGANGVHVACEVKVDVLHGDNLSITASGGATLQAKNRSHRRLTNGDNGALSQSAKSLP